MRVLARDRLQDRHRRGDDPQRHRCKPEPQASNLKELIELAKAEKLTYGMPGPGTTPHLSAEKIFKVLAKVDIPHVPAPPARRRSSMRWSAAT